MKITLRRLNDKVHLLAENPNGNSVHIDGAEKIGGEGAGFRPMQLVLASLASCSTMDLVPILQKQRQRLDDLSIEVTGERAEQNVPSPFTSINLHFRLTGQIEAKQAERAVELAVTKYCSVAAMLRATVDITYSFEIIDPTDDNGSG